jgi:hypothetical protein
MTYLIDAPMKLTARGRAKLVAAATLTRQSYGIAMCQTRYGGPRGIWLECTSCNESQVIVGSNSDLWAQVPTEEAAHVFVRHGWTGEGLTLKRAKCPKCSGNAP